MISELILNFVFRLFFSQIFGVTALDFIFGANGSLVATLRHGHMCYLSIDNVFHSY